MTYIGGHWPLASLESGPSSGFSQCSVQCCGLHLQSRELQRAARKQQATKMEHAKRKVVERGEKKTLVETRDTLAAARRDTSVHCLPVTPPLPSHSFPTPFSLFRPSIAEGWCQSCVHYNSLGWGIESLGFSVVLHPMSACPHRSRLPFERTMEEL
eukprot:scaffold1316_cov130-Isochrysis_galbana.AAC.6